MPKTTLEEQICEQCGADVRENTVFCYNCGSKVGGEVDTAESNGSDDAMSVETRAALDELAAKFSTDEADADGKLAQAAEQRRKARVRGRKSKEFVWEPKPDSSNLVMLAVALLITLVTAGVVVVRVFWP